jgi:hypothetical protein
MHMNTDDIVGALLDLQRVRQGQFASRILCVLICSIDETTLPLLLDGGRVIQGSSSFFAPQRFARNRWTPDGQLISS